jgi:rod shape-determining protein MreD
MSPAPLIPQGAALVAPPERGMIITSVVVAVLLLLLPWGAELRPWLPDWLLMLLISWSLRAPRMLGPGHAFVAGLLLDLIHGTLLGAHALAYSSAIFAVLAWQRRLEGFDSRGQALHVGPVLLLAALLPLLLSGLVGEGVSDWRPFVAGLIAALLWAPLDALVGLWSSQRRGLGKDARL